MKLTPQLMIVGDVIKLGLIHLLNPKKHRLVEIDFNTGNIVFGPQIEVLGTVLVDEGELQFFGKVATVPGNDQYKWEPRWISLKIEQTFFHHAPLELDCNCHFESDEVNSKIVFKAT